MRAFMHAGLEVAALPTPIGARIGTLNHEAVHDRTHAAAGAKHGVPAQAGLRGDTLAVSRPKSGSHLVAGGKHETITIPAEVAPGLKQAVAAQEADPEGKSLVFHLAPSGSHHRDNATGTTRKLRNGDVTSGGSIHDGHEAKRNTERRTAIAAYAAIGAIVFFGAGYLASMLWMRNRTVNPYYDYYAGYGGFGGIW